jgi:diguanylate cyclase (GGDEF)-like protein/PAS domain S-box-containing protein
MGASPQALLRSPALLVATGGVVLLAVAAVTTDLPLPAVLGLAGWLAFGGLALHRIRRRADESRRLDDSRDAQREAEACLDVIMSSLPDALVVTDAAGHIRTLNPAAARLFALEPRAVTDDPLESLLAEPHAQQLRQRLAAFAGGEPAGGLLVRGREVTARRPDGASFPAELSMAAMERDGERRLLAVLHDISERKAALSRLDVAEKVLECTREGVMVTDRRGTIQWVNHAFCHISGYAREEVLGRGADLLKSGLQGSEFYADMWQAIRTHGGWDGEIWNRRKDGEAYPEWLSIRALADAAGKVDRYVAVFSDLSSHKRAEETIRTLTYYDAVTHLPNRYLFNDRLTQSLERAGRTERKVALVMVGLDRFRTVNETLGHQVGDALLQGVGGRLAACLRGHDTVARLRGDTFCCLLTELMQGHEAHLVISRLLDCFTPSFEVQGHELYIAAAIGISVFPVDGTEPEELVQKAETAMNRSKEGADSAYQFYTPEMHVNSVERLRLETDLRKAIVRGELMLHYQPKVETATGRVVGAEALLRWYHHDLGLVSPVDFIPIAEETGLIVPIGNWVLDAACRQLARWQAEGSPVVPIAVNISAHQFRQPDLVDRVVEALADHAVDPALIELELTESAVMRNAETAIQTLMDLHGHGIRLAVDDFGTGYSSLSYLKRFPLDHLKIDRSFIHDIDVNQTSAEIVGAIIAMAHSLRLAVVAEGVETERQLAVLRQLRCDQIQGFFYSRPIGADIFAEILRLGRMG